MSGRVVSAGWVLVCGLVGAGCLQRNVPDPDLSAAEPRVLVLRSAHEAADVREAILAAMQKRKWMNERESRSEIVAHLMKKGVTVRLSLEYEGDRVTILGVTALGAGRNYEKWLSNLEESILAELHEPAPGPRVSSRPPTAQPGARPASDAPPTEVVEAAPEEPPAPLFDPVSGLPLTWTNRASFFIGVRGGLAVPPGAVGFAPSGAIELGVAAPTGFGFGLRALYMSNPPGVPFLSLPPAVYGFGALADFRYYFETAEPLILYPTISAGFLSGPARDTMKNAAMPLFNLGVGVKMKFGNLFTTFEFGVSGFTIPFMALTVGYEADSKITKAQSHPIVPPTTPTAPK